MAGCSLIKGIDGGFKINMKRNLNIFIIFFLSVVLSFTGKGKASESRAVKHSEQISAVFHTDDEEIMSLSFFSNSTFSSWTEDNVLTLWDVDSGIPRFKFRTRRLQWSVITPEGKALRVETEEESPGLVRIVDVNTNKTIKTFRDHTNLVEAVRFSHDGKLLATGSMDHTIIIRDTKDFKILHVLTGHKWQVTALAFSPDDKTLATGSVDRTIKLWNPDDGKSIETLEGTEVALTGLDWSPDGKYLASSSLDTKVLIWEPFNKKVVKTLDGHKGQVNCVAFSPDGKYLASAGMDDRIILWNVESLREKGDKSGEK